MTLCVVPFASRVSGGNASTQRLGPRLGRAAESNNALQQGGHNRVSHGGCLRAWTVPGRWVPTSIVRQRCKFSAFPPICATSICKCQTCFPHLRSSMWHKLQTNCRCWVHALLLTLPGLVWPCLMRFCLPWCQKCDNPQCRRRHHFPLSAGTFSCSCGGQLLISHRSGGETD